MGVDNESGGEKSNVIPLRNTKPAEEVLEEFKTELHRVNTIYSAMIEKCLSHDVIRLSIVSKTLEDIGNAYISYAEILYEHYLETDAAND